MLNELFTGEVPHGTDYRLIGKVSADYAFLDPIVAAMVRQAPSERPSSIAAVKELIERYRSDAITRQRISTLERVVIPAGDIDDPLAHQPPKLIGADWDNGVLRLKLDQRVHNAWVAALQNMGNYTAVMGVDPSAFRFSGDTATVSVAHNSAQSVIDYFKDWLPKATGVLHYTLTQQKEREERERRERLRKELEAERRRLEVNNALRI